MWTEEHLFINNSLFEVNKHLQSSNFYEKIIIIIPRHGCKPFERRTASGKCWLNAPSVEVTKDDSNSNPDHKLIHWLVIKLKASVCWNDNALLWTSFKIDFNLFDISITWNNKWNLTVVFWCQYMKSIFVFSLSSEYYTKKSVFLRDCNIFKFENLFGESFYLRLIRIIKKHCIKVVEQVLIHLKMYEILYIQVFINIFKSKP